MKTLSFAIAVAMVACLTGCGGGPTYVIMPEPKQKPIKHSGSSSTYSSNSAEGFRAVGPSN